MNPEDVAFVKAMIVFVLSAGTGMAELENRVDFTERRLVQDRPSTRLPGLTARTPV